MKSNKSKPASNGNPGSPLAKDVYSAQCVSLKIQGKTYSEISSQLGISQGYACDLVHASLKEVNARRIDEHEQWLEHEWATTDMLMESRLADALDGDDAAFDKVMNVMNHRAKLRGLYASTKLDMRGTGRSHPALSADQMRDNIAKKLEEFAERKRLESPNGHTTNGGDGNGTSQP